MIACENLSVGVGTFSLDDVTFTVPAGAYATLMGPTGCGKTTVIETICGLHSVRAGRVKVGGIDVTALPPGARGLGYVPQDGALFPSMDVREHLGFAPSVHGWPLAQIRPRVEELANALGIAYLLDRRVQGLSGGERQRVALGRALAARPKALILDEPLSALDETARDGMIALLKSVLRAEGVTVLHITHSPREAEALASVRFVMKAGVVSAG